MRKNLPIKIDSAPILQAIAEIRFTTKTHPDAISGIIYSAFKEKYQVMEELPIMQLPSKIRLQDPQFEFQPTHRLIGDNLIIQTGAKVISILHPVNENEYQGWDGFFLPAIIELFNHPVILEIIQETKRIGLRYIDFFNGSNIFDNLNIDISIPSDKDFEKNDVNLKTAYTFGEFKVNLNIMSNSKVVITNKPRYGSIFDIDVAIEKRIDINTQFKDIIAQEHNIQKQFFYDLITDEFLSSLNPEYESKEKE